MIVEMRIYNLKTGKINDFLKIYNEDIREVHVEILGNQLGFFYSEFGKLNQVVHLYGYDNYEDSDRRRKILSTNNNFRKYVKRVADLIVSQYSLILIPTDFSNIK